MLSMSIKSTTKNSRSEIASNEKNKKSSKSDFTIKTTHIDMNTESSSILSNKKRKIQSISKNVCNVKRCGEYNFLLECETCTKTYCMKHVNKHTNCIMKLPTTICPICNKDIIIPRGYRSKHVLDKHIVEIHRIETPSAYGSMSHLKKTKEKCQDKAQPQKLQQQRKQNPHTITNEWLIRLYHTAYAVFMEQHEGTGLSPLSRHCLVEIVREMKFGSGIGEINVQQEQRKTRYDPHNMRATWSAQALYKMISSVACVMQMGTIEIVSWGIYLARFGWFHEGLNPMQSLAITGFSVKLFLTVDYTMVLAYLNSRWNDFTNKFNTWVTDARLQRSSLTMVEINMKYMDYCKSFEWISPAASS